MGPDITANGRSSFEQLLSNVFDPSLVIGPAYQVTTVVTKDGRNLTGLIVEDNELNMKLFHDLLEAHGYSTVGTRNGIEALELARKHRPDLIIMDFCLIVPGFQLFHFFEHSLHTFRRCIRMMNTILILLHNTSSHSDR